MKLRLSFALFLALCCAFSSLAQTAPQGFNYQSMVRNATGQPLVNQTVTLLFSVRGGATNGPIVYSERHTVPTNDFGLVNLVIGQNGTPLLGTFESINWGGGAKFLTVALETAPNVFDELGSAELMSVPYALYAQTSGSGGGGGTGDNWGTQTVQTSPALGGAGTTGNPLNIAQQGATTGQVLKWDGSKWVPQDDLTGTGTGGGTLTQINTGTGLTGGPITTSGTISLANSGVTPGIYGSATQIPVLSIDAQGRVKEVFTVVPQPGSIGITGGSGIGVQQNGTNFTITNTGLTNTSEADGDVAGPFNDLQIKINAVGGPEIAENAVGNSELAENAVGTENIINGAVTAAKINNMGAANGQVLKFNGTTWGPAADAMGNTLLTGGTGISVTGTAPNFTIGNTGDTNAADDLTNTSNADGDVNGVFSNLQLKNGVVGTPEIADAAVNGDKIANGAVNGAKINQMSAANGQVLKWNGTAWAPAPDETSTGGTGADNWGTQTVVASPNFSGNGTATSPLALNTTGVNNGQVLKFNGTAWTPAADETGAASTNLTAGSGIGVTGTAPNFTISNTGDPDAADDITTSSNADGDVSGVFSNLQIKNGAVGTPELANNAVTNAKIANNAVESDQIADGAVGTTELANNAVTNAKIANNAVESDQIANGAVSGNKINQMNAANGQVLKWSGTAWAPAADETSTGGTGADNWGTQTVVTSPNFTGNGTAANPLALNTTGVSNGQILKFNGTTWVPAADEGAVTNLTGGTGINVSGTAPNFTISSTGDPNAADDITTASNADGDVAGPFNDLQIKVNAVGSPEIAENAVGNSELAVNAVGTENIINGSVTANKLNNMGAANGQVLKWNGSAWEPSADATGTAVADNWGTQAVTATATFSGNGTAASPLALNTTGINNGQILKFNGTAWVPATDATAVLTGGAGINVSGTGPNFTISSTGDPNAADDITTASNADGDVAGPFSNLQLKADVVGNTELDDNAVNTSNVIDGSITSGKLNRMGANNGQVLKWSGSAWEPSADETGTANGDNWGTQAVTATATFSGNGTAASPLALNTAGISNGQVLKFNGTAWVPATDATAVLTGGAGINVSGTGPNFTISSTGDPNAADDITTASNANGDVEGPFSNLQIKANVVGNTELDDNAVNTSNVIDGAITSGKLNRMGAANGEVLKWTGSAWEPSPEASGSVNLTGGAGINVTGTAPNYTISSTGDPNAADDITTATNAAGDVTGPFSNLQIAAGVVGTPELANTAVTTGKLADNAVTNAKLSTNSVGTFNVIDGSITASKLNNMGAANGEVLKWSGTAWVPSPDVSGTVNLSGGAGIGVTGAAPNFTISNTGDPNPNDDITTTSNADGDVSGPFNNLQIKADVVGNTELRDNAVGTSNLIDGSVTAGKLSNMGAANGQVLKWSGSAWVPSTDNTSTGTGDDWGSQSVATTAILTGNGTAGSPLGIATTGVNNGQVLKFNGGVWAPAADATGLTGLTQGAGIAITGASPNLTITNTGDPSAADDITTASIAAGDVTGPFSNLQIVAGVVGTPELANNAVTNAKLANNSVQTSNIVDASVTASKLNSMGATNNQVLKWNGTSWAPAPDATGAATPDDWGTQTVVSTPVLSGSGTTASPLTLAQQGATNGQVLRWGGTSWAPANAPGDNWGTQAVLTNATLAGNGVTGSVLGLAQQGATNGQVLRWSGTSWAPATIVGDNWGTQTAVVGAALTGNGSAASPLNLAPQGALVNQVLKFNGTTWIPGDDVSGGGGGNTYTGGTAISITGVAPNLVINNTGDVSNTNELQNLALSGNQLSISNGNNVQLPTYTEGTGIDITGVAPNFTIAATGDPSSTNELQNLALSGNQLSISGGNNVQLPTYAAGTNITISGTAPNFIINSSGGGGSFWEAGVGTTIRNTNAGNVTIAPSGSGRLGIGTSEPQFKLDVQGGTGRILNSGTTPHLTLQGTSGGRLLLGNQTANAASWLLTGNGGTGGTTNTGNFLLDFTTASGTTSSSKRYMTLSQESATWEFGASNTPIKVAIQHGNAGGLELISGGNNWRMYVGNSGDLNLSSSIGVGGTFGSDGMYTPSDRRLKRDIVNLPSLLDKVMALNPVSYYYNASSTTKPSLGFVAQDVQALFPELIGEREFDNNTYLSINYAGFGVLAIKAVQEQQAQLKRLQAENETLQQRLNQLEVRLQRIEEKK